MKQNLLEQSPIEYSAAAVKVLHFYIKPNSNCFRLHWHDRIELLRIRRGTMHLEYNTRYLTLSTGELAIIPPKVLHKGYTAEEAVEYDVLMFDVRSFYNETEICKSTLPAIYDGRAVFNSITSDKSILCCVDNICRSDENDAWETAANIYRLLGLLFQKELAALHTKPQNHSVRKIVDFIEKNAGQEISTATLCETFSYTPAHLCRKFKKATGLSPMTYLKIFRLEKAREIIKNSDLSISQVAAECGFSDANYFTRCFRAHFGTPPSRYRKS